MFQSTHSRGVRLGKSHILFPSPIVSIHALTRSATSDLSGREASYRVSIHALTRSATFVVFHLLFDVPVSIHALTRSATMNPVGWNELNLFQSTHSRGVRHLTSISFLSEGLFQSTHSRGVRHVTAKAQEVTACFNPRTHEECDLPIW